MNLMSIKTAAEQAGLTPGTLRTYEREGFLNPQRDSIGRRLYSPLDVQQARRIATERAASRGRGLKGVRAKLDAEAAA